MLQLFHKNQKSVLFILLAIVLSLSMLTFGVAPGGGSSQNNYAMKINGQEISQNEFSNARNNLESNYRSRFGTLYDQLLGQLGVNLTEQTIENLIPQTLLRQLAYSQDLQASSSDVREAVLGFFGAQFSEDYYKNFLRNTNQNAAGFETRIAQQILPNVLSEVFAKHLHTTSYEVESYIKDKETEYSYQAILLDPASYIDDIPEPSADVLQKFYEDRAADYEEPDKIKYSYVVYDPKENLDLVEITPVSYTHLTLPTKRIV